MKKLCILLALAVLAACGLTACGTKVNGDSAGKVSDTAQSTLFGEADSSTDATMENSSALSTDEGVANSSTEKKEDENLSQDLSKAVTDVSDALDGGNTTVQ